MLHNCLLNLMIRSTCFGYYYVHHQELATIQMAPTCGTSPWLWQVAGLVHGCRFERPGRGMLHVLQHPSTVAPHLGYGRLLVWYMAVGLSVRVEGCCMSCNIPLPWHLTLVMAGCWSGTWL